MRRTVVLLALTAAVWLAVVKLQPGDAAAGGGIPDLDARSYMLMEASTGAVIGGSQTDKPMPPASMSKMMTELLVLDAVQSGELHWKDRVAVSEYAAGVTGAGMGIRAGEKWTVDELFEAMAVHSANDAAVALAEAAAGDERSFVERMNRKAEKIGLSKRTRFANATGLSSSDLVSYPEAASEGESLMTAGDAARLARALIRSYPELLELTNRSEVTLESRSMQLATTNEMLPGGAYAYPGSDGLKTGYTASAGYCFTGTAERGGRRLIAVVMGTPSSEARFAETQKLFQYGFGEGADSGWLHKLRSFL